MALEWTEKLAVGHAVIDEQHRELFRRFDNLIEACRRASGKERIEELIGFLDSYVVIHFREEERLMELCAYPGLEEQKSQHLYFIGRLDALKADLKEKGVSAHLVISTNQILLKWIIRHIKDIDVKFGVFLKAHPQAAS
ncbi:bacteriohemerythrin [Desulfuromonas sp. TF]|uniref:bacteriohemerythrin n=1 Tax=Desulfuromonas sp. TF TaxID=1232410 RepID=UPI000411CD11|nr:bacteriohemerythrin [Desulfuromonas sp. TF]